MRQEDAAVILFPITPLKWFVHGGYALQERDDDDGGDSSVFRSRLIFHVNGYTSLYL